jgi:hypothetical protein
LQVAEFLQYIAVLTTLPNCARHASLRIITGN